MSNSLVHEVIPGILDKNWSEIERKIETIKTFSNKIHIDIIDGKFADNLTFLDPTPFSKFTNEIYLEAHLMVDEPINYLDSFSKAGFKRFIGHIEKMSDQEEFVARGELLGEVGLALDFQTQVDEIKVPLDDLDFVLVMTIQAGFSGQEFQDSALEKVKELRSKTQIPIEVDGGINEQTVVLAKSAGATCFVTTSFMFDSQNPSEQFNKLKSIVVKV